jgi:hypothetical protein
MRFGNKAFRDWHARLLSTAAAAVEGVLVASGVRTGGRERGREGGREGRKAYIPGVILSTFIQLTHFHF